MLSDDKISWVDMRASIGEKTSTLWLLIFKDCFNVDHQQGDDTSVCGDEPCQCSGDDWDCYRVAQRNVSLFPRSPRCPMIWSGHQLFGRWVVVPYHVRS